MKNRRAFTIVELLVVVGIIAVLVALLLPVMGMAREQAARVNCANCLHQQGAAFAAYASAWDRHYPPAVTPVTRSDWPFGAMVIDWGVNSDKPGGTPILWKTGFLSDARMLYCPSGTHNAINYGDSWNPTSWTSTYISYPCWEQFRMPLVDPTNTLAQLVADGPASPGTRVVASDLITSDSNDPSGGSVYQFNNHHLKDGSPAGGHVLYNNGSVVWRAFSDTQPRVQFGGGQIVFDFRF